jgi:hypothetical protein
MPLHRKRRATQAGSKSGPPALSGRPPKRAGCVTEFARAIPALHPVPAQHTSLGDHGVQMWSVSGLIPLLKRNNAGDFVFGY